MSDNSSPSSAENLAERASGAVGGLHRKFWLRVVGAIVIVSLAIIGILSFSLISAQTRNGGLLLEAKTTALRAECERQAATRAGNRRWDDFAEIIYVTHSFTNDVPEVQKYVVLLRGVQDQLDIDLAECAKIK